MRIASSFSIRPGDNRKGFSLVEVVLAIGVLAVAITALLGLLGPTLLAVKNVVDTNKATASMGTIDSFIQDQTPFNTVYGWLDGNDAIKSVFVFTVQDDLDSVNTRTVVWDPDTGAFADRQNIIGTSFLVNLSKSRLLDGQVVAFPTDTVPDPPDYEYGANRGAALPADPNNFALAYIPILVEIYRVNVAPVGPLPDPDVDANENNLILTYTTAKNR
jgi:prepilin-type N-terminal cleavage/methylation domain-containing protein